MKGARPLKDRLRSAVVLIGPSISCTITDEDVQKNFPTLSRNISRVITSMRESVISNHSYSLPSDSVETIKRDPGVSDKRVDSSDKPVLS